MSLYVDEIFDEVSVLATEEREQVLALRCAGHPSLEAEVRGLLHAIEDGAPAAAPVPLEPGAKLGRYRLEQRLGEGATASVWKAWDTHLETFTALKLLHPNGPMRGHKALDAVMHEARAASGVLSEHVVRIKTAGKFEGGLHFIEMELCAEYRPDADGSEVLDVGRTFNETALDRIEEIVRVAAEAARGVDAAHRVGVLHRDLKPSNILLTPVSHRAKVTDFGLAAPQLYSEPTAETSPSETITVMLEAKDGKLVGTPSYMPPEQAFGHPPTRATDVYALGSTLYAMLAERTPYEASGKHPIPALDVVAQVRHGPPAPLRTVAPRVPRRLARIVERAMARSPKHRYRTAVAFADDLEAWLAHRPTSVDGRNPLLRVGLTLRRNRELATSIGVLLLILALFAGSVGWLDLRRRSLEHSIAEAVEQRQGAELEAQAADEVRLQAEQDRDRALEEAESARAAQEAAKRSEAGAEERSAIASRQARQAREARDEAEAARDEALAARDQAVLERESAEVALETVQESLAAALEARDLAETRTAQAEQAASEATTGRTRAEEALADARLLLDERQAEVDDLRSRIEAEVAARRAADAELSRLTETLAAARSALDAVPEGDEGSPQPGGGAPPPTASLDP